MASVTAPSSSHVLSSATVVSPLSSHRRPRPKIFIRPMNSFMGLKSDNRITSLGSSPSSDRLFAHLVAQCAIACRSPSSRGGAAASTCDAGSEIFRVVPIITALTLIGVALGFVLLRVEAALEESDD